MKPMKELLKMWNELGDILVDDDGNIKSNFYHFNIGVNREDIWHWFESQNPEFIVGDII